MNSISFPIPHKENERRRALLPRDVASLRNPDCLYFEEGFGGVMGISDRAYLEAGAKISKYEQLFDHPIVCCMKAPGAEERERYCGDVRVIFGWIHAVQGLSVTDWLLDRRLTAVAWEDMHDNGRHVFWENNEIAGSAAVQHAALLWGRELSGINAALIGRGNVARGAYRALSKLGAKVVVYDRKTSPFLSDDIGNYQWVVNAVLWDVFRTDHIVSRADLARMTPGSMIVDVSCDDGLGIETSHSTSIAEPIFEIDGVLHYAVDHTPSLLFRDASSAISRVLARYVDELVEDRWSDCLKGALIIESGTIRDERITRFQRR